MSRLLTDYTILGGHAFFVEEGVTVDSKLVGPETVVSPAAGKPDVDPLTNWPSIGVVKTFKIEKEVVSYDRMKPKAAGGYLKERREMVTARYLDIDLEDVNDLAWRAMFGIGAITLGTAQIPDSVLDEAVKGWLKFQGRSLDGTDLFLFDVWVEARLRTLPSIGAEPVRAGFRFQVLESTLNTIVFPS